jgi:hypothetical protein
MDKIKNIDGSLFSNNEPSIPIIQDKSVSMKSLIRRIDPPYVIDDDMLVLSLAVNRRRAGTPIYIATVRSKNQNIKVFITGSHSVTELVHRVHEYFECPF